MCSFEFQSCQETYAYIWRGRELEMGNLLLFPSQSELFGWQG